MKKLIILLIAVTATFAGFAQKSQPQLNTQKIGSVVQYTCSMHPDVSSDKPGKCPKCDMNLIPSEMKQTKIASMKTYSCPMHSKVTSKKPGKCSECGTKLVVNRTGSKQLKSVTYSCPTHSDINGKVAGSCPRCGMSMVKKNKRNL